MAYLPRIVDAELAELLGVTGAVLVEGPKASGKTATAMQAARSEVLLDVDDNARRMIGADPGAVLDGDTPRLIDEWQLEPAIWNHVRRTVDRRAAPGRFILTGSAVPRRRHHTPHRGRPLLPAFDAEAWRLLEQGYRGARG